MVAMALCWWVERVRRLAWPVVIGSVLLALAGGVYTASHLRMNTDIDALLSPDLPYRKIFKAFEEDFPQMRGNLVVVVESDGAERAESAAKALAAKFAADHALFEDVFYPMGDPFFHREGLLYLKSDELQQFADRIVQAKPLLVTFALDRSLRGFFGALGDVAEGVKLGKLDPALLAHPLGAIAQTVEGQIDGKSDPLSWRDLVAASPGKASDRRQIIQLKLHIDPQSLSPAVTAIKAVRATAAELGLDPAHGVRVRITGSPALDEDDLKTVRDGVGLASAVSLVLVSIIVFLGLRSPRLVFATLATLVLSLVWTAAYATLAVGYLNMISVAFAVLFIGLAVDFSIQFGLRYKESVDRGSPTQAALREAAGGTGVAVTLAAVCAAIGFFAFVPTDYIGLSQLGIIAGGGMFIGLFATLTLLPAILTLLPVKPSRRAVENRKGYAAARLLERHARAACLGALAVGLVALTSFPWVRFDIDPINLKSPDSESVQVFRDMTKDSRTSPYSISIVTPNLGAADALAKRLDKLPEVAGTVTLSSFLPSDEEAKLPVIRRMAASVLPILQAPERRSPPSGERRRDATEEAGTMLTGLANLPNAGAAAAPARHLAEVLARFNEGPGRISIAMAASRRRSSRACRASSTAWPACCSRRP